ncbi:MAG: transcriptional regulator [Pseudomonadota bacterium]
MTLSIPTSQGELIKRARGEKSQAAFAKELGVDRTCLSRYESEKLGAPTKVLNYCLRAIAAHAGQGDAGVRPIEQALQHVRQAVDCLERAARTQGGTPG